MRIIFLSYIALFTSCAVITQTEEKDYSPLHTEERGYFRVMFYNCENYFDTVNDSLTMDEEFLPDGLRYWTPDKFYKKLNNIGKVITAVGGWDAPDVVGVCEIENRYVLDMLVQKSVLRPLKYQVIHKESPDARGIDVGFLYRPDRFTPITYKAIPIVFPFDITRRTRDVLYVTGYTRTLDTLHIFVNHWPSRLGGQTESERSRMYVASVVRNEVDSIVAHNPRANIIIMGDLNDYPDNISLTETLQANITYNNIMPDKLYNLSYYLQENKQQGTHKIDGHWGALDQVVVSGALLYGDGRIYTTLDDVHAFDAPFLLEPDETSVGMKPCRTYIGYKFNDGFSDHLPVFFDLRLRKP